MAIHRFQVKKRQEIDDTPECKSILFFLKTNSGSGAYAVNGIGAAAATGDGDVMMRFLPSLVAVEALRNGKSTQKAAQLAIHRIRKFYPKFFGASL